MVDLSTVLQHVQLQANLYEVALRCSKSLIISVVRILLWHLRVVCMMKPSKYITRGIEQSFYAAAFRQQLLARINRIHSSTTTTIVAMQMFRLCLLEATTASTLTSRAAACSQSQGCIAKSRIVIHEMMFVSRRLLLPRVIFSCYYSPSQSVFSNSDFSE